MRDPTAFKIFGTDYETADGTAVRDYIHVLDLAEAHVRAIERLADGGESMALNLGTGTGTSVREIVTAVERASGVTLKPLESPRRAGDPPVLVADSSKAQGLLDWTPQRSDVDTVVADAWRWHTRAS